MNDARVSARPRSSQAFTGRASSARAFRTAGATSTRLYVFRLRIDFLKIFDWLEAACATAVGGHPAESLLTLDWQQMTCEGTQDSA
jgi:hypothetical protein